MDIEIWALHGFLGHPGDFDSFVASVPWAKLHAVDIVKTMESSVNFQEWSLNFLNSLPKSSSKKILMGYSMGGRFALHVMKQQILSERSDFDAFVFLSAGLGLKTEQEKQQRILDDQKWVENFVEKPWDQALKVWNSQSVFQHSSEKTADEKPWPRWAIEKALTSFGLATQEDFRSMVKTTKIPTMYVLGEMDFKYQNMWKEIGFTEHVQKLIILDQGHRVLKGSQEILSTALFNFVIDRFQSTEHAP